MELIKKKFLNIRHALMMKCKAGPRFSVKTPCEAHAKIHLMYLGLAKTAEEAKVIYLKLTENA